MGGLFSKPKSVKAPPVPPPAAVPEVGPETEDWAARAAKRKKGWASTVLTGALEPTSTGKKTRFG